MDIDFKAFSASATISYLTDCAVPACLHMVLALIASVDKAVLALVVQLYQHAHGAPFTSPQRAELPVLVPSQSKQGITTIHQVTGQHRIWVHNGWQGINKGPGMEVDNKKHLVRIKKGKEC